MNKQEFVEKWTAALRSGKYEQIQGNLHRDNEGYCCLGVACEVAIESGVELEKNESWGAEIVYDGCASILPEKMYRFLNINPEGIFQKPVVVDGKEYLALTQMNDSGVPFSVIADVIEEAFAKNNFLQGAE